MKTVKLTPAMLKQIIAEESKKFGDEENVEKRADDTEETDADELADSLDKHIDFMKALKIEEARLIKRLSKVQETRKRAARSLIAKI